MFGAAHFAEQVSSSEHPPTKFSYRFCNFKPSRVEVREWQRTTGWPASGHPAWAAEMSGFGGCSVWVATRLVQFHLDLSSSTSLRARKWRASENTQVARALAGPRASSLCHCSLLSSVCFLAIVSRQNSIRDLVPMKPTM